MSIHSPGRWLTYSSFLIVFTVVSGAVLLRAAKLPEVAPVALEHMDAPALFAMHCMGCHDSGRTRIAFDGTPTPTSIHQDPALWENVAEALRDEKMPPQDMPPPHRKDRERMIVWIESNLANMDNARVAARRLGALEYRNAVRDLLGVDVRLPNAQEPLASSIDDASPVILPADFPEDENYWALYPGEPMVPAPALASYRAVAAAVLDRLAGDARFAGMNHAEQGREVERVARRAFRRTPTSQEIAGWQRTLNDASLPGTAGLQAALSDVLTSPQFLHKIERRPIARRPDPAASDSQPQFELASRLAGFLWSSVPDDELLTEAQEGKLASSLDRHVARMLADERAEGFGPQFANHWLHLDQLDAHEHVPEQLRRAMRAETERLVSFIVQENRDIIEFLDAEFTFIDETMARHYGIDGVHGEQPRWVSHSHSARRGLLGHASILTITSSQHETSPIRRGRWILETLLGERVPPPPFGTAAARSLAAQTPGAATSNPSAADNMHALRPGARLRCGAYCHAPIAGLGMTLENYGSVGTWRTEQVFPTDSVPSRIDAIGVTPTGEPIAGPLGLSSYLMDRKEEFLRCLSGKLLTYGLARRPRASDAKELDRIVERLGSGPWRFADVVQAVAASDAFQRGFVERWNDEDPANP